MTEIEIKAHVYDRNALKEKLKSFAVLYQTVEKHDTYYHLAVEDRLINGKPYLTCRIRREFKQTENGVQESACLTYKKKEIIEDISSAIEVNDEKESLIENPEAVEVLLADIGFTEARKKIKKVEAYSAETPYGKANLELCNVEKLGDFLEIEILSEKSDKDTVERIKNELKALLKKSGIPENQIEPKYYNQMLRELEEQDGRTVHP